jgi:uncharacterized transporter YbjL
MNDNTFGFLIGGVIIGLLLGLIPLIAGVKKNHLGLAIGGFFSCIAAGAFLGFILSAPTAAIFWWIIKNAENKSKDFKD